MLTPITPLPLVQPMFKVKSWAVTTVVPIGISNDRATLYGAGLTSGSANGSLYESTNDGTTWTLLKSSGLGTSIQTLTETDDGEAVILSSGSATPGYVYKSSGWSTSHSTATWTLKLTSVGGLFDARWSGGSFGWGNDRIAPNTSKYGVACEYGAQTTVTFASGNSDTTDLIKGRRVYWTEDYGNTWSLIFDIASYFPNGNGLHCHAVAYDPYWDRIWLTWGDTQTNTVGTGNVEILYSDNHGVSWNTLSFPTISDGAQSTSIAIGQTEIMFGSDNRPGLLRIPRTAYRTVGNPQYPVITALGTATYMIASNAHRNRRQLGAPLLMSFQGTSGSLYGHLYYSPDGINWTIVWADYSTTGVAGFAKACFGPTLTGKIVAWTSGGGNRLLVGEIEELPQQTVAKRVLFVGDGTTTVFTTTHGLGYQPRMLYASDMRLTAPTYTLTADATNITVTFATAPANAVEVSLDVRYA